MTVAGEVTAEDRQWAYDFIHRHLEEYCTLSRRGDPRQMPNWHRLFHQEWSSAVPANDYDDALWLRREVALEVELKAACARLSGRCPAKETEVSSSQLRPNTDRFPESNAIWA